MLVFLVETFPELDLLAAVLSLRVRYFQSNVQAHVETSHTVSLFGLWTIVPGLLHLDGLRF